MDYSQYQQLEFRRKFWKFVGAEITITEPTSLQVVGFIKMKAWKLREDIRLYTDASMQQEVIRIKARQIIDFGATYDVFDSATDQVIISLRRKGFKSAFFRDHWDILDPSGAVIGAVQETSGALALVRRWLAVISDLFDLVFAFVPQTYTISQAAGGAQVPVGNVVHRKNPFVVKMLLDTSLNQGRVDSRVPVAATTMLAIIDAAKNN